MFVFKSLPDRRLIEINKMQKVMSNKPINAFSIVAQLIAAATSLCFMFIAGHNNKSAVLMLLFTVWVVSPYAILYAASKKSFIAAKPLDYTSLIISIGSIIAYTFSYFSPGKTPAFIFLLIPLLSWIAVALVALLYKRKKGG